MLGYHENGRPWELDKVPYSQERAMESDRTEDTTIYEENYNKYAKKICAFNRMEVHPCTLSVQSKNALTFVECQSGVLEMSGLLVGGN